MTDKARMWVRSAVVLCGLSVAAAGAAIAQDQAPPPPDGTMQGPPPGGPRGGMMEPGHRAEHLKHELGLTDDQTAQVKAIFEDSRAKMQALRSNSALSQDDRRSQMMTIHKAEHERIEALLTPDQKTKFDSMRDHMRGQGGPGGPPPSGDAAPPPPPQN